MNKRILIVGGVAGGASAATRLRRNNEKDEIIMFEKGPHVSFSNCALPYHLSGTIQSANRLVLMTPEKFKAQYNIEARVSSEVLSIDKDKKEIKVKNLLTNEIYTETYDKLIYGFSSNLNVNCWQFICSMVGKYEYSIWYWWNNNDYPF